MTCKHTPALRVPPLDTDRSPQPTTKLRFSGGLCRTGYWPGSQGPVQIYITESNGEVQSFMGSDFKVFQPWAEPGEGSTVAELKKLLCMSKFNSPQGTQVRGHICTRRPDEVELVYLGQGESNYGNLIECQKDMTAWVDDPTVGPDPKKEEHVTFSLFESFVGYGLPSRENKEIQRIQQALKLADCRVGPSKEDSLEDLDGFGDFPFWITDDKKKLVFGAEDAHTQRDWVEKIDTAILAAQNRRRETAAVRDAKRGNILLDSKTLADYKIKQGDCFAIVAKPGMSVARGGGSEPEPEMHSVETSSLVETGEKSFGRTTPGFDDGERTDAQNKEELMDSEAHEGDEDFKTKVVTTSDMQNLQRAAAQFVSKTKEEIIGMVRETLEGHQRAIMAELTVDEIYKDRLMFQRKVRETADVDLAKMGLRVISYTLKDVSDENGYMQSLGVRRIEEVKKEARMGEAQEKSEADQRCHLFSAQVVQTEMKCKTEVASSEKNFTMREQEV